jgi:hypothetical protein
MPLGKAYRVITVDGYGGALSYLLVELSEDGVTERILPLSYRTAAEAEQVKAALERDDAIDASPPPPAAEPLAGGWQAAR